MAKMTRKQVYIEPRQDQLLKERARRYRVTEAELIRRALDRGLETAADSSAPDPAAWREFLDWARRHRRKKIPRGRRRWKREDLYDR